MVRVAKHLFLENTKLHFVAADEVVLVSCHAPRPLSMIAKDNFLEVQPALDPSEFVAPLAFGVTRSFFRHLLKLLRLVPVSQPNPAASDYFVLFVSQYQASTSHFCGHVAVKYVAEIQISHCFVAPHVKSGDGKLVFGAANRFGRLKKKELRTFFFM